ncbi:MAG: diaminobutyrate--2-oxoglutarate transaminase [Pseudomonadota bacterium]
MSSELFERLESNVRSYCRSFPTVFKTAENAILTDETGAPYIDFLSGAGSLNYGHNNPAIRDALIQYLLERGVVHSLDLYTTAKRSFLEAFSRVILEPRQLDYKLQFTGPTGTNAVEAALKIARKATGRSNVAAFTRGFHGMTLGALAATANGSKRKGAGVPLSDIAYLPYDGYFGESIDTLQLIEDLYDDPSSGYEPPAAFLVETVQGEGGLACASPSWLQGLAALAKRLGALLIVDDIQAGCGRTGRFFSFERMGVVPDIVCLSKSLGGMGLPLAVVLLRPEFDLWEPGEHNGTFRGNNLAFVAATAALSFWEDRAFLKRIESNCEAADRQLSSLVATVLPGQARLCGRGLMLGVAFRDPTRAAAVSQAAFERGVIAETCGPHDEVLKILPPLTIEPEILAEGISRIGRAAAEVSSRPLPHDAQAA